MALLSPIKFPWNAEAVRDEKRDPNAKESYFKSLAKALNKSHNDIRNIINKNAQYNIADRVYYPDSSAADQGIVGNGRTVKAYIDTIGSSRATIVFWHTKITAGTTYMFLTSLSIPANIRIIREEGAYLSIANGKTLTFNNNLFESPLSQAFVLIGTGAVIGLSVAYPEWFNFSTSASAANNAAYMAAALAASAVVQIGTAGTYNCNPFTISTLQTTLKGLGHCGGGVIFKYAGVSSFITVNANRCRIEDLYFEGPGAADGNGDIGIDVQNAKWKCVFRGLFIFNFDTSIKDDGYDNVIKETQIYNFGAIGVDLAGGANAELDDVTISDAAASGICVKVTGTLTHLLCKKVIFGSSNQGIKVTGALSLLTCLECHWEGVTNEEIYHNQALGKVNIIGGKMNGNLRAGTSAPNSTNFTLMGVYAASPSIANDMYSKWIFINCWNIGGADVGGTAIELDKLDLDENGNLLLPGTIKLLERAAAIADTPGYGQVWIKNTTPCELWFTDDAGTDTKIV